MDEKLKFLSRFFDTEKIAPLFTEFGISRVTGHRIIERYKDSGLGKPLLNAVDDHFGEPIACSSRRSKRL
jgi:hypothetical protein